MKVSDFHYELPPQLIAQQPLADRAASRMLVVDRKSGTWRDLQFRDFPQFLATGDCLVLNDTRVMPSRLYGTRAGGTGQVEVLLLEPLSADRREWKTLVRPGRRLHEGAVVTFDETIGAIVTSAGDRGERTVRFLGSADVDEAIDRLGHMPLPPYIRRDDSSLDRERYQTVFSRERGSAAAPTAGLHFIPEILDRCRAAGVDIAHVTLHVGLGTFAPLRTDIVEHVKLHAERYSISPEAAEKIRSARRRVAVGTTSVRTMETLARRSELSGATDLFLYPGGEFQLTNALLTNFHLPESSLLMLVCAFAGRDLTLAAYQHAIVEHYRFFSYGDCMLIL